MSLVSRIRGWWAKDAEHYTVRFVADGAGPLVPHKRYLRLWVSDLFLAKSRHNFTDRYPTLQSSISLDFAGTRGATFSTMLRAGNTEQGPGVMRQQKLTELLPYAGGTVGVHAALMDIEGKNHLRIATTLVADFATLLTPPLSAVGDIAKMISGGIDMINEASNQEPLLVYNVALASVGGGGANVLTSGYHVVVKAPENTFGQDQLHLADDVLINETTGRQLTGYDYFVLRIESRSDRDDWRFPAWDRLISSAIQARTAGRNHDAKIATTEVLTQIFGSSDLTPEDRPRVAQLVKEELDRFSFGAAGTDQPKTLAEMINARGLPHQLAVTDLTLEQLIQ
jgi:hypothetical protein